MTRVIIEGDLIVGSMKGDAGGVPIPDNVRDLPSSRLRFDGETIVDAAGITDWFVDSAGVKHVSQDEGETRQGLSCAWDTALVSDAGAWRAETAADRLAAAKAARRLEIDAAAEVERLKYITRGAGQAMTYQEKAAEVELYLLTDVPVDADYPMLSAEIGITGETLADVVAVVGAQRAAWQQVGAAIEAARLGAKKAVDAAATLAEVEAIAPAWPGV